MYLFLYISGILAVLLLTAFAGRRWGRMPARKEVALAGIGALLLSVVYLAFTTVLVHEGNGERLPFLFLGCIWVVLACVRPSGRAGVWMVGLTALFVVLKFYHLGLAVSRNYTDSPSSRHRSIRLYNLSAVKYGKPLRPAVVIYPTLHTWLTGLYSVKPVEGNNHTD